MTTNQEARHQDLRDSTSTARGMTADWHALWDGASVADGTFNERLLAWINAELGTSYTNLPGAMHAYAANGGFANWHSINVIESGPSYAVNSNEPDVVADFAGVLNSGTEYYRVGGSETTFASMFTHARASDATMVDSDGLLKWAPHNLLTYSEDFSNAVWNKSNITVSTNAAVAPDGETTADLVYPSSSGSLRRSLNTAGFVVDGAEYTGRMWIKKTGSINWVKFTVMRSDVWFDLENGVKGSTAGTGAVSSSITADGAYYVLEVVANAVAAATDYFAFQFASADASENVTASGTDGYHIWGMHCYRSDLGGMVNNPDRGDSYVSTTSAARYLPRRNHYRYNGSSYVKTGILLESAAATNLVTHSNAFDNASWTEASIATVGAADATGIGGTTSATTITASAGAGAHAIYTTAQITSTTDVNYTSSVYVKKGTNRYAYVTQSVGTNDWITAVFDLDGGGTTATQTQGGANSGTVAATYQENIGNGFYRLSITGAATGPSRYFTIGFASAATGNTFDLQGNVTFTAAGTETLIIDGAQFELGSVPTSYIPTSGATATRTAETITIAGSNMAASTTAMSMHWQGEINFADRSTNPELTFVSWGPNGGNLANDLLITTTNNLISTQMRNSFGTLRSKAAGNLTAGLNTAVNYATRRTLTAINIALSGTAETESTFTDTMPNLSASAFNFGPGGGATTASFNGTIALFRQDDSDWTDAGLEEATS